MLKKLAFSFALGAIISSGVSAEPVFQTISLAGIANTRTTKSQAGTPGMLFGELMPSGAFSATGSPDGTIPFDFGPALGDNFWSAHWAALATGDPNAQNVSASVDVNLFGVETIYSALNTWWGMLGDLSGSVTLRFNRAGGGAYTKTLFGGVDIRDYNQAIWTNTLTSPNSQQIWNNLPNTQRIDMQSIDLPVEFQSDTLTTIVITDLGDRDISRAFLFGLSAMLNPSSGGGDPSSGGGDPPGGGGDPPGGGGDPPGGGGDPPGGGGAPPGGGPGPTSPAPEPATFLLGAAGLLLLALKRRK